VVAAYDLLVNQPHVASASAHARDARTDPARKRG
jgi:hypothetical protein